MCISCMCKYGAVCWFSRGAAYESCAWNTVENQQLEMQAGPSGGIMSIDTSNDGKFVISRSDESTMLVAKPKGGMIEKPATKGAAILTEKRAKILSQAAKHVAKIFNQTDVLDIEWVLETKSGQDVFWIVQARPYVINKSKNESNR